MRISRLKTEFKSNPNQKNNYLELLRVYSYRMMGAREYHCVKLFHGSEGM